MRIAVLFAFLMCVACASPQSISSMHNDNVSIAGLSPRIMAPPKPLQCVPFARKHSGIQIYGDAWTWWSKADSGFAKGTTPRVGAVMVIKGQKARRGHLAVVTKIVNERQIVVKHANWLNRGRIHLDAPVVDVSPSNNWGAVRVWYTPGRQLGISTYAVEGFIYPRAHVASRN